MKSSKSNIKISVATNFFEASCYDISASVHYLQLRNAVRISEIGVGKDISMRVVITGDSCKVITCEVSYE